MSSPAAVDSSSSGDTAAPLPGAASAAPPPARRIPAPCWTHPETLALISAYRDKWYALRRGNLRAAHWQEVADAVSSLSPAPTPKTAVQCRHKIEKLRKRYRADRLRSLSLAPAAPPASPWLYFRRMDAMERGVSSSDVSSSDDDDRRVTVAVPKRAAAAVEEDEEEEEEEDPRARVAATTRSLQLLMANGNYRAKEEEEEEGEEEEEEEEEDPRARVTATTRSLQHLMASRGVPRRRGVGGSKPAAEEMRRMERRRREEGGEMRGVVGAIRRLGDNFVRVEQMKIEMARDMERERMEMEMKRTEMVLDCQRWLAESWAKELAGKKKRVKVTPDS